MVTCTVCLIAKNEGPYLVEWIAYYRNLGFDRIVVYENNSTDESAALLTRLAKAGLIDHRPWKLGATSSPQLTAYLDAVKRVTTDWILFVDCDEFLVLHHQSLKQFLRTFHGRRDISAIAVNWRIYGSSHLGTYDERPVIERFTWASEVDFPPNHHVKAFLRTGDIGPEIHMHISDVTGRVVDPSGRDMAFRSRGLSETVDWSEAQINHYYTKTLQEYQIKKQRGQAGEGETSELKYWYNDDAFNGHNVNDVEDKSACKYLEDVRRGMTLLQNTHERASFWDRFRKTKA